jgi:hypothetical protein
VRVREGGGQGWKGQRVLERVRARERERKTGASACATVLLFNRCAFNRLKRGEGKRKEMEVWGGGHL